MTYPNKYAKMYLTNNYPSLMEITMKKNLKIFIILISCVAVILVGVGIALLVKSCSDSPDDVEPEEYLPKDYGDDPSGLDDDHTARY